MSGRLVRSAARQHLGYMAQKFSLYKQLTVAQNLSFFAGIYGLFGRQQQTRIDAMVKAFALGPWLGQQTESLPLGLCQRLSLACSTSVIKASSMVGKAVLVSLAANPLSSSGVPSASRRPR